MKTGKSKHWSEKKASEIINKRPDKTRLTIQGGVTPSTFTIGNARDPFVQIAVAQKIEESGLETYLPFVFDNRDPLTKIPEDAPSEYKKENSPYIGMPLNEVPDFWGCHRAYDEHRTEPVLDSFENFGVDGFEIKYGSDIHKDRKYIDLLLRSIEKTSELRHGINEVFERSGAENKLKDDWKPWNPQCSKCGRIDSKSVKSTKLEPPFAEYICSCGHEGRANILKGEGKPPWVIDWSLRWILHCVDAEPLGKDHMAAGSSFDRSSEVARIMGFEPPFPIFYEHIMMRLKPGSMRLRKLSGRIGDMSLDTWPRICHPEVLRYMLLYELQSHIPFHPRDIPVWVDRYDEAERIYFGTQKPINEQAGQRIKVTYELSQVNGTPTDMPLQVPYDHCITISQVVPIENRDRIISILKRGNYIKEDLGDRLDYVAQRIEMAREWVNLYAPEFKMAILEELPHSIVARLSEKQAIALKALAKSIKERNWTPIELHNEIYRIIRSEVTLTPQEFFSAGYAVLLGRTSGPKLAQLILTLDKNFVTSRFENLAEMRER